MRTLLLCLFVAGPAFGDDFGDFWTDSSRGFSWTEKSSPRLSIGIRPYEGTATALSGFWNYKNWDINGFVALKNENVLALNETDIGFGYTFPIDDSWSVRTGLVGFLFPDFGDQYIFELDVFYSGPLDVVFNIDHSLTDPGTQYLLTVSKGILFGGFKMGSFTFVPSIQISCAKTFFRMTGCPTNLTAQGLVSYSWGKNWGTDIFFNYQKGGTYGKGKRFEDVPVFGITLNVYY